MSQTVIQNAPNSLGNTISYDDYFIIPRDRLKDHKKLSELFYSNDTDSYWVFEWTEAIDFLKLVDSEDSL